MALYPTIHSDAWIIQKDPQSQNMARHLRDSQMPTIVLEIGLVSNHWGAPSEPSTAVQLSAPVLL
jgi:hypothetical protein